MRNVAWVVLLGCLAVNSVCWAADDVSRVDRDVLNKALLLAGLQFEGLPITLTSVLPSTINRGAEAWTVYDDGNHGDRIFVYTGSELFQCVSRPRPDWQCQLKLASILVHEAWHFRNGKDELGAYDAQIAFLVRNGADNVASGVRRARNQVLAARRKARHLSTAVLAAAAVRCTAARLRHAVKER
jgi:hypothetical protein